METKVTFRMERDGEVVEISSTDVLTLNEHFEMFERFLKACSFELGNNVVDLTPRDE